MVYNSLMLYHMDSFIKPAQIVRVCAIEQSFRFKLIQIRKSTSSAQTQYHNMNQIFELIISELS